MKLLIFVIALYFIFPPVFVLAQESSPSATIEQSVEYTLPYPGLLPDSPLYPLKVVRDKIVSFLVTDPLKKAEYNLLQADKRLQSGVYLLQKGKNKEVLALGTISKGENYFHDAIGEINKAKQQKLSYSDLLSKMETASKKHQEILEDIVIEMKDAEKKQSIQTEIARVKGFEKELQILAGN